MNKAQKFLLRTSALLQSNKITIVEPFSTCAKPENACVKSFSTCAKQLNKRIFRFCTSAKRLNKPGDQLCTTAEWLDKHIEPFSTLGKFLDKYLGQKSIYLLAQTLLYNIGSFFENNKFIAVCFS